VIGWRLVKQAKKGPTQILVVDFAVRFGLGGKHKFGTLTIEHVPIFTDKGFADAKKRANRPTWNFFCGSLGLPWRGCDPTSGRCEGVEAEWKGLEYCPTHDGERPHLTLSEAPAASIQCAGGAAVRGQIAQAAFGDMRPPA
jgi:hypothetical protein